MLSAYAKDRHFRTIWKESGAPSDGVEKEIQTDANVTSANSTNANDTDANVVDAWVTTRAMEKRKEAWGESEVDKVDEVDDG